MNLAQSEEFALPVAKRQKLGRDKEREPQGSRLFAPFRTIGLVSSTTVPFTSVPRGKTTFQITTSIGQNIQTYDLRKGLSLIFLSRPNCPEDITATCAYKDLVFVAWGSQKLKNEHGIWVFKRGKLQGELDTSDVSGQCIRKLIVFGNWVVGFGDSVIEVWRCDTYEHYTSITPDPGSSRDDGSPLLRCLTTLPTFLNKIFVGKKDGSVDIFNVNTGKLVHVLQPSLGSGSVTALSPAPATSLLAVGFADGSITVIDVESEEVILRLGKSVISKPITCISFRSDGEGAGEDGRKDGIMATASIESGDVTLWNLNDGGKIAGILRGAHAITPSEKASGITNIEFLPGQPVLISTGLDNSLKSWIFDQVPFSPVPRPLHARQGHSAAISALKFVPAASDGSDANGKWLLSAGKDRSLWGFSLRKDAQSTELSQGRVQHKAKKQGRLGDDSLSIEDLKCSPITSIACSLNRDGGMGAVGGPVWTNPKAGSAEVAGTTGWESVVTAHENDRYARTWFWGRKKAGRWAFETGDHSPVTSIAITTCGTFAIIGSAGGSLDMFNLQSGIHRQRFPPKLKAGQAKQMKLDQSQEGHIASMRGHKGEITGIVVDTLNQTVVSTGLDGQIIFWDFATGKIRYKQQMNTSSANAIRYNPVSNLVSMACDDSGIRIIDMETKKTVRELWGCIGQIYDHCFSHDGRWIVACSMDSVIRVFDLATGHLVDAFKTTTCTNVAFSSTGEFLATAHAGSIGIKIWNNKSLFMHIPPRQIDDDKEAVDLSSSNHFNAASQLIIEPEDTDKDILGQIEETSMIDQLNQSLLTLSLVPRAKWQTLLHLETIRERNKPIQPPQKPKAAPFFLGSAITNGMSSAETAGSSNPEAEKADASERSRVSKLVSFQSTTSMVSTYLDKTAVNPGDGSELIEYLSTLSPSAVDLEIRSLAMSEMPTFVAALTARLKQKKDFELVNTWMSVFLRIHGEFVSSIEDVRAKVLEFHQAMIEEEARLSQSLGWARGVLDFLRSAR